MRGNVLVALGVAAIGGLAAPAWVAAKATDYVATIDVRPAMPGQEVHRIAGYVFEDHNRDGRHQPLREPGIPGVLVSDGYHVVASAKLGQYIEITPENIDTFHFHGDITRLPLTAILAVPSDHKSGVLLRGRYVEAASPTQIVRPTADIPHPYSQFSE